MKTWGKTDKEKVSILKPRRSLISGGDSRIRLTDEHVFYGLEKFKSSVFSLGNSLISLGIRDLMINFPSVYYIN